MCTWPNYLAFVLWQLFSGAAQKHLADLYVVINIACLIYWISDTAFLAALFSLFFNFIKLYAQFFMLQKAAGGNSSLFSSVRTLNQELPGLPI